MTGAIRLDVRDLSVEYPGASGVRRAVDRVSFTIGAGEVVGLVGESASGKSTVAAAIGRLLTAPGRIAGGQVLFDGTDLTTLTDGQMRRFQGSNIGFVFQDPMSSLNPVRTIGSQIAETLILNAGMTRRAAWDRAGELLDQVGMARRSDILNRYPHHLSGGMQQRVMIAMALACRPRLLIADEPTTALDVTVQARLLELLSDLVRDLDISVLLITHDLGVAAEICDRIMVMYSGQLVEQAATRDLFDRPQMPYTRGLLACLPAVDDIPGTPLRAIPGAPPPAGSVTDRCRFAERCDLATELCFGSEPELTPRTGDRHVARCWATAPGGWADADAPTPLSA